MTRATTPLAGLDLNLLLNLDALLGERSVTRAAERLEVSQPTMSRALQTLREALGDELLVRSGRTMMLTPQAQALAPAVADVLRAIDRLGAIGSFDPQTSTRRFRIGTSDIGALLILPGLIEHCRAHAPGVTVSVLGRQADHLERLLSGQLDLAIGQRIEHAELRQRHFPGEPLQWSVLVGRHHPSDDGPLTAEQWFAADHVQVLPQSEPGRPGPIDAFLAARSQSRRVVLELGHVASLAATLERTQLLCTLPRAVALRLCQGHALRVVEHPLADELPQPRLCLSWHERLHGDAGHVWLRNALVDTFATFTG